MRFVHQQPQYETTGQASNFLPEKYSRAAAPVLYVAGCANGVYPCSGTNRQAMDPLTGQFLGTELDARRSARSCRTPGTRPTAYSVAGQGIAKTAFKWPADRRGAALRDGLRPDRRADASCSAAAAGCSSTGRAAIRYSHQCSIRRTCSNVTVRYGQLQTLGSGLTTQTPPALNVFEYDSELPASIQWNGGVQMALPWAMALDVSYVGQHQYRHPPEHGHQPGRLRGGVPAGQSGSDAGRQHDAGRQRWSTDLMRAFQGYSSITQTSGWQERTYHSLQLSLQRRFRNGLSFGFNDTIGLYDRQNTTPRLQHDADGTSSIRADQAEADKLLGDNNPQAHIIKANFVWDHARPARRIDGAEDHRGDRQRLAARGHLDGGDRQRVRDRLQLQQRRRQREHDRLTRLRRPHPHRRRHRQRVQQRPVPASSTRRRSRVRCPAASVSSPATTT